MPLDQIDVDKLDFDEDGRPIPGDGKEEMSFFDHLEELRWHIIRSLIAVVVGAIVLFIFQKPYFDYILLGPLNEDFLSYRLFCWASDFLHAGNALCFGPPKGLTLVAIGLGEAFIQAIRMCFMGGIVVAFPYIFYEIWSFVQPGLYETEQRATRWVIFFCSVLFFIGVTFGYFVVAPFAVNFLGGYQLPNTANTPTIGSFVGYMVMFTLPAGLIFELPIVVYFLARFGLIDDKMMKQYRRHSIVGILIVASILTPPDVMTQFLIGVPLYFLYEISIFIAKRASREYQRELR